MGESEHFKKAKTFFLESKCLKPKFLLDVVCKTKTFSIFCCSAVPFTGPSPTKYATDQKLQVTLRSASCNQINFYLDKLKISENDSSVIVELSIIQCEEKSSS